MLEGNITMFDSLVKSAEVIQKIIPLDCCIMICNKEGLIVKFGLYNKCCGLDENQGYNIYFFSH